MKAECPAQKEQQRQETLDFQDREAHQGQREAAPRALGGGPSTNTRELHTLCPFVAKL